MKTGLVLEGGALRTIYSSGVCDAFLDGALPMPDYTVGVSAGMAYGVSYLSRQSRRNLQLLMHYADDPRYMGWRNLIDPRNRSYFGLRFAYETIPNELVPFDYEAFEAYPGQAEAVVTNLLTGQPEYRPVPRRDEKFLLLQATCAMPVLFRPIRLDGGIPYLDGGCSDAIPWQRALEAGCDRVVVILTRERGKLSAAARGCRKPASRLFSCSEMFTFGEFVLYEGRNRMTVDNCEVRERFYPLREDLHRFAAGAYMTSVADACLAAEHAQHEGRAGRDDGHAHPPPLQRVKGRQRGGAEFLVFIEARAVHVAGHEPDALQRAFRQAQKRRLLSHCHPPCSKRGPCICGVFRRHRGLTRLKPLAIW